MKVENVLIQILLQTRKKSDKTRDFFIAQNKLYRNNATKQLVLQAAQQMLQHEYIYCFEKGAIQCQ